MIGMAIQAVHSNPDKLDSQSGVQAYTCFKNIFEQVSLFLANRLNCLQHLTTIGDKRP